MRKHDSFRAAMVAAFPDLARNPQAWSVWIDKGRVAARAGPAGATRTIGFEWRYTLNAVVMNFAGDTNLMARTVIDWIRVHQPEVLLNHARGAEAFGFEVDVLDEKTVDLVITIELDEAVDVAADGTMTYRPEPVLEPAFADVPPETALERVFGNGGPLAGAFDP